MVAETDRHENLMEVVKGGTAREVQDACAELAHAWKDAPVESLLALKEQFHKLDIEDREAHLDSALITIAEKRPAPFTAIATEPGHPLWRPTVEVLSLVGSSDYLDLFISLLPISPKKNITDLLKAIGCYSCNKVVSAAGPYLGSDDERVFMEAVLTIKRCGGPDAIKLLRESLADRRRKGSEMSTVLEAVLEEMREEVGG